MEFNDEFTFYTVDKIIILNLSYLYLGYLNELDIFVLRNFYTLNVILPFLSEGTFGI
jgi:hypothetical protein